MTQSAVAIVCISSRAAHGVNDVGAIARRIDRHHRLQINPDQVLWEEARTLGNGANITRLCVDTLIGAQEHRIHIYGCGEEGSAGVVITAATRHGNDWVLIDTRFARKLGMDLLFEVCRDEVMCVWQAADKEGMWNLLDELTEHATRDVLEMHWTPKRAARYAVAELTQEGMTTLAPSANRKRRHGQGDGA